MKQWYAWLWCGWMGINALAGQEADLARLEVAAAAHSVREWIASSPRFAHAPLPTVQFVPDLAANGRFARDTIFLGIPQAAFSTPGDWQSLVWHEYFHFLESFRHPRPDTFLQFLTDTWTHSRPSRRRCREMMRNPEVQALDAKSQAVYRRQLRQPVAMPFYYAPSWLAREEIRAYRWQLRGQRVVGYELSPAAHSAVKERLRQLRQTLRERKAWERAHPEIENKSAVSP